MSWQKEQAGGTYQSLQPPAAGRENNGFTPGTLGSRVAKMLLNKIRVDDLAPGTPSFGTSNGRAFRRESHGGARGDRDPED
jgi:hypothetical protein